MTNHHAAIPHPVKRFLLVTLFTLLPGLSLFAREYHVAKTGDDQNSGSLQAPLLTIQAAAIQAVPGDTITVHEGIYREQVTPPRGGISNEKRITYRAAPGDKVAIKGSAVIRQWKKFTGTVWKAVIPNAFFGDYNPYKELIRGDWFLGKGRIHHTGEIFLNGESLWEAAVIEKVLHPEPAAGSDAPGGSTRTWYCESDAENTYLYANFQGANPNQELVEINVRPACFYPDTPGIHYITVKGFHMSQAATQWAPPTAEQKGLIGTRWSKGWIIEENVIRHSKCAGITLGKYGDEYDNTSENSAEGYIETIKRALERGWSKANTGDHIIRNNTISHCEQAGICGSMGGVFSVIENNDIHDIWTKRQFTGPEIAGIKIHGSVDMLIKGNRIVNAARGIWLDWMAQGARVTGNLCYRNILQDFYSEVNHGPYLVDNNLFLSLCSVWDMSQGGAYVHNLMAGRLNMSPHSRVTPFLKPHATEIAGYHEILAGDHRFFNNLFVAGCPLNEAQENPQYEERLVYGKEAFGLRAFEGAAFPVQAEGNAYLNGATPMKNEPGAFILGSRPGIELEKQGDELFLVWNIPEGLTQMKNRTVDTPMLGRSEVSGQAFVNPDNSSLTIDEDFSGNRRGRYPVCGPFEISGSGKQKIRIWKQNKE